jgi:cysteine-rich repeat protein
MKLTNIIKRKLPRLVLAVAPLALVTAVGCGEADFAEGEVDYIEEALCASNALARSAAAASSNETSTLVPGNAIDGNTTTRWSSAFANEQWLRVDLGASRRIKRVRLNWEAAYSANYEIQLASSDAGPWTTVYSTTTGNGGIDDITGLDGAARYVRVLAHTRATPYGNSLYEVEVYGDTNPSCNSPVCGNGVVESGELCDDGNTASGDGCSSTCQTEATSCTSNALARSAAASSSNENTTHVPGNAIDGSTTTRWSSSYANEQWLRVDLGASRRIKRVKLNWEAAYSGNYEIQVSGSDAGPWTSVFGTTTGNGAIDDITGLDATGRYVRVLAHTRATSWGNSLWEVDVYGDNNPNCGGETPAPLTRKVLWLIYDPILSGGQRLHTKYGFNDPFPLVPQIISTLQSASHGYANYQNVEVKDLNAFPPQTNRATFTEATYDQCFNGTDCGPTRYDYGKAFQDLNICSRIQSGEVDEVMIYGADWFGMDEFAFKIPGDRIPYNTPTNLWLYEWRKYNLPDCGKTYFVMGFNSPVGLDNAIHSFGHRVESALSLTVGRGYWDGCPGGPAGLTDWDRFTCIDINKTASGANVAGCGNVHYPPNGQSDYDYGNTRSVSNACQSWQNYPFTTPTLVNQTCSTYGCDQIGYMQWWLGSLPLKNGVTSNGNLRNWWKYAIDFDNALREVGNL